MPRLPLSLLLMLTAVPLLACCANSPSSAGISDRNKPRVIAALNAAGDADSLAAAATLSLLGTHSERALPYITRATALAPARADLLWAQIRICARISGCDTQTSEARLQTLDASNGAGWLDALARAETNHDDAGRAAALSAIARSQRVDLYWTELAGRQSRAIVRTGRASAAQASVEIIGIAAATVIPAIQLMSHSCRGEALQDLGRLDLCRGIARSLQKGDTILMTLLGDAIAKQVWPQDSPEWATAAQDRRVHDYRVKFAADFDRENPDRILDLYAQFHREDDVLRQVMIDAGHPPDPPSS